MKFLPLLILLAVALPSCVTSPERADAIRVGINTLGPILERRGIISDQDLQDIRDGAAVLIVEKEEEVEDLPAVEVTASK